jgi:hypothetical protein
LNTLVPEDWVYDGGGVNAVENYGSTFRGDTTRESLSDRDANALADLFFQPTRCSGHELIGCRVVKQDCGGVAMEKVQDAVEEQGQELVEIEGCERCLCESLEPLP